MIITFVGHGTMSVSEDIIKLVFLTIKENVKKDEKTLFYCGGYGSFDCICAEICNKLKKEIPLSEVVFVTPYLDNGKESRLSRIMDSGLYDSSLYPPLESTPKRVAISKRNEWMIRQADLIIAYVDHSWGGAYKALSFARRRKKKIINLADEL